MTPLKYLQGRSQLTQIQQQTHVTLNYLHIFIPFFYVQLSHPTSYSIAIANKFNRVYQMRHKAHGSLWDRAMDLASVDKCFHANLWWNKDQK